MRFTRLLVVRRLQRRSADRVPGELTTIAGVPDAESYFSVNHGVARAACVGRPAKAPRAARLQEAASTSLLALLWRSIARRGRRMTKVVVPPAEFTSSVPPCESTIWWAM